MPKTHRHGPQTTACHDLNDSHQTLHIPPLVQPTAPNEITLDKLAKGQSARVTAINAEGALRRRLLDMGITPGTVIKLHKVAPMGDPLELKLRGYALSLRKSDAHSIGVVAVENGERV